MTKTCFEKIQTSTLLLVHVATVSAITGSYMLTSTPFRSHSHTGTERITASSTFFITTTAIEWQQCWSRTIRLPQELCPLSIYLVRSSLQTLSVHNQSKITVICTGNKRIYSRQTETLAGYYQGSLHLAKFILSGSQTPHSYVYQHIY